MGQPGVRPRGVLACLLLSSVRHFISCFSFYLLFPLSINPCSFGLYLSTTVKGLQRASFKSILQREPIKYMQMAWGGGWSDWGHESAWNFHVEHGSRDTAAPPLPPQQSVRAPRPAGAPSCPAWGLPSAAGRVSPAATWHIGRHGTSSLSSSFCAGPRSGRLRSRTSGFQCGGQTGRTQPSLDVPRGRSSAGPVCPCGCTRGGPAR